MFVCQVCLNFGSMFAKKKINKGTNEHVFSLFYYLERTYADNIEKIV